MRAVTSVAGRRNMNRRKDSIAEKLARCGDAAADLWKIAWDGRENLNRRLHQWRGAQNQQKIFKCACKKWSEKAKEV